MKKLITGSAVLFLFSTQVFAETVYIQERQVASIRSGPTAGDEVVGQAATGIGLELIEQNETHAKVQSADGVEGWVANGLITRKKPAAMRILSAETRLKQAQKQAGKLSQRVKTLEKELKNKQSAVIETAEAQVSEPAAAAFPEQFSFNLLWIGISFAMLIAGFVAGVVWLRERTRRKLGGMHIRVS